MFSEPPARLLLLRPDTYGDLFLFEPVPRIIRHAWPRTEVAVLIRKPYEDAVPLFAAEGVRWLTTTCNPYRESPSESRAALEELRGVVRGFAPDCVVAACAEQHWLESAVAALLPEARQITLGQGLTDPFIQASLDTVMRVDWPGIFPEKIPVETEMPEWEKNLRLVSALCGGEVPRWRPAAKVPEDAKAAAAGILAGVGLPMGGFIACLAAGIANVQIKSWPAEHYGSVLARLERERGIRALLVGHGSERELLEAVRRAARDQGADPALWTGRDGEMPVVAGLLEAARFCFGNDTGALHLAAALGRPVVSIFGGGHWPRFQPVAHRALTVVQPLPCFGCAWDCYFTDAPCVRTISPASVWRALEQFLQDDAEGQTVFEVDDLDAGARALIDTATPRLRFLREDRAARGKQILELTALLAEHKADRAARGNRPETKEPEDAGTAMLADLRGRLQGSQAQEKVARTEARRLARERALAHRLLKFSFDPSSPDFRAQPALVTKVGGKIPRLRAAVATEKIAFHIDAYQNQGTKLTVSGWAFCRVPEWDGRTAMVTLLFRHGTTILRAAAERVTRPDVAAYFEAQRVEVSGGARGLEGSGFACEIARDSLTAGVQLEMALHLECAGMTCEQSTGERLWI